MSGKNFDYCIGTANVALKRLVAAMLNEVGFTSAGEGKNIPEFLRLLRITQPWLALVDTQLPPGNIKQLASIIEEDGLAAALYLDTANTNLNGYMTLKWPVEAQVMTAVAETLCLEYARKMKLKQTIKGLEDKLSKNRDITKAKGILMNAMSLDEDHAYRYLQKISMERRISMVEMARKVISDHGNASS